MRGYMIPHSWWRDSLMMKGYNYDSPQLVEDGLTDDEKV